MPREKKTTDVIVKMLKKIMHLSNSNLVHIDNGFLSKKRPNNENDKEWIGKDKKKNFSK